MCIDAQFCLQLRNMMSFLHEIFIVEESDIPFAINDGADSYCFSFFIHFVIDDAPIDGESSYSPLL